MGISGERIAGLERRILNIIRLKPKRIICLIGINDILNNVSFKQLASDLIRLNQKLKKSRIDYFFVELLPLGRSLDAHNEQVEITNKFMRANNFPMFSLFDENHNKQLLIKYSDDDLHLNKRGYSFFIEKIEKILKV